MGAISASAVNGFGVVPSPSLKTNVAFTSRTNVAPVVGCRGELTKVEMGVVNPPPNETTGIKALGLLGFAGACLGLIVTAPFSDLEGPGGIKTPISSPAVVKSVSAPKLSAPKVSIPNMKVGVGSSDESTTKEKTAPAKKVKKASTLSKQGYNFDGDVDNAEELQKKAEEAAKAKADKEAKAAAEKEAKAAEAAAEKEAKAAEAAAEKEKAAAEKAAKAEAIKEEKEAAAAEKKAKATADKEAAEKAKASTSDSKATAEKAAAEKAEAKKAAAEKAEAEKAAAEKTAAEKAAA